MRFVQNLVPVSTQLLSPTLLSLSPSKRHVNDVLSPDILPIVDDTGGCRCDFVPIQNNNAGPTLDNTLNALTDSPIEAVLWRTLLLEASGASTTIGKLLNIADGKEGALNSTVKERFLQAHMKMIKVSVD